MTDTLYATVYRLAEQAFARQLTAMEAEILGEMVDEYGLDEGQWRDAFKAAASRNVRNLRYVEVVAKNGRKKAGWYEQYADHIQR